ncbi:ArsR/SmtB family transcription factor [Phycisphaera mikurensis]|uniref:Putative ArsR family transcriptional regulator n=1 Tax=Phycisphaera mikurensis (strain NBRC 102666 / KCTC 22515 / FYK2301M01) TaxID=1142394 RepID=I0IIF1_PHYMF|nr:helix-turn-helix domain-containing protein [Phycisphaera mikurensis]MBB6442397.1 DNA-binding transcriptional ArsR family regulator [Phycisphaera mikurensis]BAM05039.1 putative ArsR family transcriptional regulator [Phycisphaera mikurensis NBRC 102666]
MPPQPSEPDAADLDLPRVLRALADPVRLDIVRYAHAHPGAPCSTILADVPKSTASHHWRVLREAGLLHQEPAGRQKLNHLRKAEVDTAYPGLLDAVLAGRE